LFSVKTVKNKRYFWPISFCGQITLKINYFNEYSLFLAAAERCAISCSDWKVDGGTEAHIIEIP
jgi:hypothetical protein